MAVTRVNGIEFYERQLSRMDRGMIRKIVEAGATAAENWMRKQTQEKNHIRNSDMLDAIGRNEYRETYGGGSVDVYPQGIDRKGVRNADKMYITNYGRGGVDKARAAKRRRRGGEMGDKFITRDEKQAETLVHDAMQAESDRLMEELNK